MSETVPNESEWAERSAARLKAVWVDFASAPPPQRAQFLKEELSRAIKPIPSGYRKNYLERLKMKFPWAPLAAPPPAAAAANQTPVETATFEDLAAALLIRVNAMTPEEKASLAKQLEPLLPFPKPPPVVVAPQASAGNSMDRPALETALNNFVMLDDLARKILRDIAPQSPVNMEGDLRTVVLTYLRDGSQHLPKLKDALSRRRKVTGGLLMAISGGPPKFANDFWGTFSPDNIMAEVGSAERRCWNKYMELAKQDFPTAAQLGFRIRRKLAEYAEEVIKQP